MITKAVPVFTILITGAIFLPALAIIVAAAIIGLITVKMATRIIYGLDLGAHR